MAPPNPINILPRFQTDTLPCEGKVGDLLVISPLDREEWDPSDAGLASIWLCTIASLERGERAAVWVRLQPDGFATCAIPVPPPPQDIPELSRG